MTSRRFASVLDPCRHAIGLWKVSFVPGYQEVSVSRHSAGDELIVIRIRRDTRYRSRIHPLAKATLRAQQGIDLVSRERKPGPKKDSEYLLRLSSEKHGTTSPWFTAKTSKASLPSAEIIADTRTFVSTTAPITFASRAGRLKFQRRFRARRVCPGLASSPRPRLSPANREAALRCE